MKKGKLLKLGCAFLCIFGLVGCKANNSENVKVEKNQNSTVNKNEKKKKEKINPLYMNDYINGYSYVTFSKNGRGTDWLGYANKDGEITVAFPDFSIKGHSVIELGYFNLYYSSTVYVVDEKGEIVTKINLKDGEEVAALGAGYTVIEKQISDFENNYFEYTIYNQKGESISVYEEPNGEQCGVDYIGKGVFSFNIRDENDEFSNDIYFSNENKWVRQHIDGVADDVSFYYSDRIVIRYEMGSTSMWDEPKEPKLVILDKNGNVSEVQLPSNLSSPFGNRFTILDDNCLISNGDEIMLLNLETRTIKRFEGEYFDSYNGDKVVLDNNVIAVSLNGKDGEEYVALFDMDFNIIGEPVRQNGFSFSNGRLLTTEISEDDSSDQYGVVYSDKLEKLYSINLGEDTMMDNLFLRGKYSDKLFINNASSDLDVYDLDGNIVFSGLDITNTTFLLENEKI